MQRESHAIPSTKEPWTNRLPTRASWSHSKIAPATQTTAPARTGVCNYPIESGRIALVPVPRADGCYRRSTRTPMSCHHSRQIGWNWFHWIIPANTIAIPPHWGCRYGIRTPGLNYIAHAIPTNSTRCIGRMAQSWSVASLVLLLASHPPYYTSATRLDLESAV